MNDQPAPSANPDPATEPTVSSSSLWSDPRRRLLFLVAAVFAILLIIVGLTSHSSTNRSATNFTINVTQVQILKDKFLPNVIGVKAGTTVTWINKDTDNHWVASDPYPKDDKLASLNSMAIQPKASYSYTFNTKGTFTYHDDLHPYDLQGSVVVK